jgi:hypothetical protein
MVDGYLMGGGPKRQMADWMVRCMIDRMIDGWWTGR